MTPAASPFPWKLLTELTHGRGHGRALQRHANTHEVFSICLADEHRGLEPIASWSLCFPVLTQAGRWILEQGTHSLFSATSQTMAWPAHQRAGRELGQTKGGCCMIWHLLQLPAKAPLPAAGALISSIGFSSSASSANAIFNTPEGSLSHRCLFHHLCPSGAHFKLAEHHLLGKQ